MSYDRTRWEQEAAADKEVLSPKAKWAGNAIVGRKQHNKTHAQHQKKKVPIPKHRHRRVRSSENKTSRQERGTSSGP
ncbi:hypothetical protein E4U43_004398 [Claviceps pusilla]|uniref:Uncharacterized protein n=1 Tax=Claviceps pusilla TaxID=123648 RepID=A0A9P7SX25_9HYPO|nr:hypothetical protein E4U43_004398 [Claviceps pusilla]